MMNKVRFVTVITIAVIFFSSCSYTKMFFSVSGPERWWVIGHPFSASEAEKISMEARKKTNEMIAEKVLDGDGVGGQLDAFRHAYWMARLSQEMKPKRALKLGFAHEKGNYKSFKKGNKDEESVLADSVSCVMDTFNNRIGTEIGWANMQLTPSELSKKIIAEIEKGRMLIIHKDFVGNPLDCVGSVLDTSVYLHKWNTPKCLVPSNTARKETDR